MTNIYLDGQEIEIVNFGLFSLNPGVTYRFVGEGPEVERQLPLDTTLGQLATPPAEETS